jgi:deazaflavin-dependent oxidoreductase (nitroreductase family)
VRHALFHPDFSRFTSTGENSFMSATHATASAVPRFVKFNNSIIGTLLRSGVKLGPNTLLTVPGRKSGTPRTTPVAILELNGERYVQSTFGRNIDWVRNLRASGEGTIKKGRREERIRAEEISAEEAGVVYQHFLPTAPSILRKSFDVKMDAPLTDYIEMAKGHPMFRITTAEG